MDLKSFLKSVDINIKTYFGINLPIIKYLKGFIEKVKDNNITIVKISTGSGKTTVLPAILACYY
jgi:HrpA-like RNA helicase